MSTHGHDKTGSGGNVQITIFIAALLAGSACSLTSKIMLNMKSIGLNGELEDFSFPLFQTLGMFFGMSGGLVMHFLVLRYKIPFPGYVHAIENSNYSSLSQMEDENTSTNPHVPLWMYFMLIFPSIFDLIATALCTFGLKYVNVSIYQILRGSAIVFVAILKQYVLKHPLTKFMWIGIFWNVVSIILVGFCALVSTDGSTTGESSSNAMLGVGLILSGAMVQSLQYAFEEKVMSMTVPAPPLLLIGMEGVWGTLLCVFVLYPLAMNIRDDHGNCIENPFNTWAMIQKSTNIQIVFIFFFVSVLAYNILACLVTFLLSSVWHAILDNFRPITVWGIDLFLFYFIAVSLGEAWTSWSWVQLIGLFVLLYGTAIYNAPNAGSIKLVGRWFDCWLDCTDEYAEQEVSKSQDMSNGVMPNLPHNSVMSPFLFSPQVASQNKNESRAKLRQEEAKLLDEIELNSSYGKGGKYMSLENVIVKNDRVQQ